jgi:O-antigen/teichoic acid export membrane protein
MLIRHSMVYVVARLLAGVFSIATTALLTRILDPSQYGIYGLALVIGTLGFNICFVWLGLAFTRFGQAPRDRAKSISTIVGLFAAAVILTGALALALVLVSDALSPYMLPFLVGIALTWALAWFELTATFEIITFQPLRNLGMNVGRAILVFIFAGAAAWITQDPIATTLATALGMIGGSLIGRFPLKEVKWQYFDRAFAVSILLFGLPFIVSMTMEALVQGAPRIMIQTLDSSAALGHYTAAYLLVTNTLTVLGAGISSAGYSLAVRAAESGDAPTMRRQLLSNGELLFAVTAPAALGLALTADGLATTVVGPQFGEIAPLIPWMAFGAFVAALRANFLDHAFQLSRTSHLQIWVSGLGAAIAIGLSIYLIPRTGALGAAVAVAVACTFSFLLALVLGKRVFSLPLPLGSVLRVLACCAFMAILVRAVPGGTPILLAAQILIGILGYSIAALTLNLLHLRTSVLALLAR